MASTTRIRRDVVSVLRSDSESVVSVVSILRSVSESVVSVI